MDEIIDTLAACRTGEERDRAGEEAFRNHAYRHGWRATPDLPPLVEPENEAPCPPHLLDFLEELATSCRGRIPGRLHAAAAHVLEHNGRVDAELRVLQHAFNELVVENLGRSERSRRFDYELPLLARDAAEAAARAGRHDLALRFAEEWRPTSWCGTCADGQRARIGSFRLRSLVKLGRWAEVNSAVLDEVADGWCDAELVECWIEAATLSGDVCDPEVALQQLLGFVSDDLAPYVREAYERWCVRRGPRTLQLDRLPLLVRGYWPEAVALVARLEEAELERHLTAFDVTGVELRDTSMISLLALTGASGVGRAIERAERETLSESSTSSLESARLTWNAVREQLDSLREP
jgi:hypothetical protein